MMKLTRRQFLKGLLATAATAAILPETLIEPLHGASDLTAQERDAVADVLGLRQKQWAGVDLPPARPRRIEMPLALSSGGFGKLELQIDNDPGGYLVPPEFRDRILHALICPEHVTRTEHVRAYTATASWTWKGTAEKGEIWTAEMPDLDAFSPVRFSHGDWIG